MTKSTSSSRVFFTSSSKLYLVCICIVAFWLGYLAQNVNCNETGGGRRVKLAKAKKSVDSKVDADSKSLETSHDEKDDNSEYYLEEDSDIKIRKIIPSSKTTPSVTTQPSQPKPFVPRGRSKSIGNRIDNDRDVELTLSFRKPPRPPVIVIPEEEYNNNKLDFDSQRGLTNAKDKDGPSDSVAESSLDSKMMKNIADEVAEAILLEADKLYSSMSPEDSNNQNHDSHDRKSHKSHKDDKDTSSVWDNNILKLKTGSPGDPDTGAYVICPPSSTSLA